MNVAARAWSAVWMLLPASLSATADDSGFPDFSGPYFGQEPPSHQAGLFMDGVISRESEPQMNTAFSKDGRELLYCARHLGRWAIFVTREEDGRWLEPEPLFSSEFTDRDLTMAPDGATIYFGSDRPRRPGGERLPSLDIVFSTRSSGGGWSDPLHIGPPVNTEAGENYPSVAANGNLYFFSCREGGHGGCDLYLSRLVEGRYTRPSNLGTRINGEKHDWDGFIAPDESYIIFSSQDRADTLGGQDLYIAYRRDDGTWTTAMNMGVRVNSPFDEICPSVSLDGEHFFFTSRRRGTADIYWISANIVQELKP